MKFYYIYPYLVVLELVQPKHPATNLLSKHSFGPNTLSPKETAISTISVAQLVASDSREVW